MYVILVKLGQDERDIEGSDIYAHRNGKTLEKVTDIAARVPGVMYQDIQSSKPTRKGVAPHSRLIDTI